MTGGEMNTIYKFQSCALLVFFNIFTNKKWIYCIFIKFILFKFLPVLFKKPTPSQINLIKNAKNNFLLLKKLKNTDSAQLCNIMMLKFIYICVYTDAEIGHEMKLKLWNVTKTSPSHGMS